MSNQAIRNQRVLSQSQAAFDSRQPADYWEGPNDSDEDEAEPGFDGILGEG